MAPQSRTTLLLLLLLLALALAGKYARAATVRVAVIGDFGDGSSRETAVQSLVRGWDAGANGALDAVVTSGDNCYPSGTAACYANNVAAAAFYAWAIAVRLRARAHARAVWIGGLDSRAPVACTHTLTTTQQHDTLKTTGNARRKPIVALPREPRRRQLHAQRIPGRVSRAQQPALLRHSHQLVVVRRAAGDGGALLPAQLELE